jgi:NADPH-dependent ferric siderophore reductase
MDTAQQPSQRPARKRGPPRRTTVRSIERVTPRVIRVIVGGDALEGFGPPRPGGHIKLFFDTSWNPHDEAQPRPPARTYTPRTFDPAAKTLAIEFVLHGDGLAAGWVQRAKEGDALYVGGPGGGWDVPADAKHLVIAADDTAMPAAGMIIEALPPGCKATVLCEIADKAEERPLSPSAAAVKVKWLHVGDATPGSLLEREVKAIHAGDGTVFWIACESGAMRRIKAQLKERGVDPTRLHTRGYWRLGETNYPDHDYGND